MQRNVETCVEQFQRRYAKTVVHSAYELAIWLKMRVHTPLQGSDRSFRRIWNSVIFEMQKLRDIGAYAPAVWPMSREF